MKRKIGIPLVVVLGALTRESIASAPSPPDYNCPDQPEGSFDPILLQNGDISAQFIRYGATITHLLAPDQSGTPRDVILGFDYGMDYCAESTHPFFGATIGRVANRIEAGTFSVNGETYDTPLNENGYDTLHGGFVGADRWQVLLLNFHHRINVYLTPPATLALAGCGMFRSPLIRQ